MRSKKCIYSLFYRSTAIVAGMSSLLVSLIFYLYIKAAIKNFTGRLHSGWFEKFVGCFFCYWSTGIVTGMGFPTFVADQGYVSSPPNMMIHMALD